MEWIGTNQCTLKPKRIIFDRKMLVVCAWMINWWSMYFRTVNRVGDVLLVLAWFVRKTGQKCVACCQDMPSTFEKGLPEHNSTDICFGVLPFVTECRKRRDDMALENHTGKESVNAYFMRFMHDWLAWCSAQNVLNHQACEILRLLWYIIFHFPSFCSEIEAASKGWVHLTQRPSHYSIYPRATFFFLNSQFHQNPPRHFRHFILPRTTKKFPGNS